MLEELSGTEDDAVWLVSAGFWEPVDDGWQFVEWAPDQPLREIVLEGRRKNAEKVKDWRHRNHARNPGTPPGANPASNGEVTLPPSRPVPTRPSSSKEEDAHPAGALPSEQKKPTAYSAEFEEFWELYPRKQDKLDAFKAYTVARKKHSAKTLRDGAQAYTLLNIGTEKGFLKLPAGWIRGERWNDEQIGTAGAPPPGNTDWAHRLRDSSPTRDARGDCPKHPDYPAATEWEPCAPCERDRLELAAF